MENYENIPFKNSDIDRIKGPGPLAMMRLQAMSNSAVNKLARANKGLDRYVNSSKAPAATKEKYNYVKNTFLGGTYEGKDIKVMTDVNYNDKKTDKFKNRAAKAWVKMDKADLAADKAYKKSRSKKS